jgi:hypothetical protein
MDMGDDDQVSAVAAVVEPSGADDAGGGAVGETEDAPETGDPLADAIDGMGDAPEE